MEEFKLATIISVILLIFFTVPTAPQTRSLVIKYKLKRLCSWIEQHPHATTTDRECMDLIQSLRRSVRKFPSDDKQYEHLAKCLDSIISAPKPLALDMPTFKEALETKSSPNKTERIASFKNEA